MKAFSFKVFSEGISFKNYNELKVFHILEFNLYFLKVSCGKGVKKNFKLGELFPKISNYIYLLIH